MIGVEPARADIVELNRTRLRTWEWGELDDPGVLLVHGAHDHGRMWDGFAPRIAALGYRVVALDIRGHGDSGPLSSGEMWAASALDLALLARQLGPPVGIIGHSFGAGQSMYAAGVWPELFRWVVNLDGLGFGPDDDEQGEEREWDIVEGVTRSIAGAERVVMEPPRIYPTLADMVERRQGVNTRLPREWVEHLVAHGAREVEGGFTWKADPMFRVGFPDAFGPEHLAAEHGMLEAPMLVLTGGEHDTWSEMSPATIARRLTNFRDVRHRVIEGAGHYVHIEQPDAVVAAIADFLAEVDAR